MRHQRARELIIDGLVEQIDGVERQELRSHLAQCSDCAALQAEYGRLWEELDTALVPGQAADGLARLQAAMRAELGDAPAAGEPGTAPRTRRLLLRAAAVVALIGAGVLLGAGLQSLRSTDETGTGAPPESRRYLVLIHATTAPPEQGDVASEMGAWLATLTRGGVLESTQGAEGAPEWMGPAPAGPQASPAFFIVIRAASLEEARQIAATSPSLAYGGAIEVRPVDEQQNP